MPMRVLQWQQAATAAATRQDFRKFMSFPLGSCER